MDVIPILGTILPNMGTKARRPPGSGAAGALFTAVQQRVLGLLFGDPDREFQSAELIRLARSGTGAVHRQLRRLEAAGIVTSRALGNQRFYRANRASPVFSELHGLIVKTFGLAAPLRAALRPHADGIELAFVYGSVAAGVEDAESDIDLLIVSDTLDHATVYEVLGEVEAHLGRSVNPTLLTSGRWRAKAAEAESFVGTILRRPTLMIIGRHDDLDRAREPGQNRAADPGAASRQ